VTGATKSTVAYDRARRDIVTGVIAANEPIDEAALGTRYGLGRTPIREALKQLRNDQLVVWPDRRSPYVPEIGVAQVKALYEARSVIETQIAALAARRITADATDRLDRLVTEEADLVERDLGYQAAEVDLLFHQGVAEATGNPFLVDASTRINVPALRIWYRMIVTVEMIAQEHADIVEALRHHDVDGSVAAVDRHIRNAYDRYIRMTSRLPGDPGGEPVPRTG
jgi:DNA-binding GntR family transcriptional regulator